MSDVNTAQWKAEMTRLLDGDGHIDDPIATLDILVTLPDGRREEQQIALGRPLDVEGVTICQIRGSGPIKVCSGCVGVSSFHALASAVALIRDALHKAVTELKYQLRLDADGEAMTVEWLDDGLFGDAYFKPG